MQDQNFTVNACKDTQSERGYLHNFYSCRSFSAYEDGEIILNGVSGTDEDCVIYCNKDNYQKVFITNANGKTVYANYVGKN